MFPDLNLLPALDALLSEGNVSGAAQRLGLSTSAMSRTLARLRLQLGDAILVPAGRKMVPTPHAEAIREDVARLCRQIATVMRPPAAEDPRHFRHTFALRTNEAFVMAFAAGLTAAAAETAPGVQLSFVAKLDKDIRPLRDGSIDLDIGVLGDGTAELKAQTLYRDRFVGVVRAGHPILDGPMTLEAYVAAGHVVASRRGKRLGPVDDVLAANGMMRAVKVLVPSFPAVMAVVAASDLVGLVPRSFLTAGQTGFMAGVPAIEAFELPVETPEIVVSQSWHPRVDAEPAHRWLRGLVFDTCRRILAERQEVAG